jgi:uncharacterized protein (DUF3084 family)
LAEAEVQQQSMHGPSTVIVKDMSEDERKRIEDERRIMEEQRGNMKREREAFEAERDAFAEERKKAQEDRIILQSDLNNANKESATWLAKYDGLKDQLGDLAEIRAKYEALQVQMAAVAAMASVSSEDDKKKADVGMKSLVFSTFLSLLLCRRKLRRLSRTEW